MWRKILLILVPLIVLGIALTGAHLLVERLFILMILLLLMSYLVARLGTRGLRGNLRIPERHYQAGQAIPGRGNCRKYQFLAQTIPSTEDPNRREISG